MTEYTSIRVTQAAKEAAEASKRDGETWNDYLQRCTDNPPEVREFVDAEAVEGEALHDVAQSFSDVLGDDEVAIVGSQHAIVDEIADRLSGERDVTLEASERRAIAEEVAEVLGR